MKKRQKYYSCPQKGNNYGAISYSFSNYRYSNNCRSFSLLKAIAIRFSLLSLSHLRINVQNDTKNDLKRLRVTTFHIAKLKER